MTPRGSDALKPADIVRVRSAWHREYITELEDRREVFGVFFGVLLCSEVLFEGGESLGHHFVLIECG